MTERTDDDYPDDYIDIEELEDLDYRMHMGTGWEQYNAGDSREAMDALREIRAEYGDDARIVISGHDEYTSVMTAAYTNADSFGESTGISVGYFLDEYLGGRDLESQFINDSHLSMSSIDFYQIDVFYE